MAPWDFIIKVTFLSWLILKPCYATASQVNTGSHILTDIEGKIEDCQNGKQPSDNFLMGGRAKRSDKDALLTKLADCKRRLRITITIGNEGKTSEEPRRLFLEDVYDVRRKIKGKLYTPMAITLHQQPLIISYPFTHGISVNNKPYEAVLHHNLSCNPESLTYSCRSHPNIQLGESGQQQPGFCCSCDQKHIGSRANQDCEPEHVHSSAHCLKFDPLWYSVNKMDSWSIHHSLTVDVFTKSDSGWVGLNTEHPLHLGTGNISKSTEDNTIAASYETLPTAKPRPPINIQEEVLLIPEPVSTPALKEVHDQLQGGPYEYLVLPNNLLDVSGSTCDKVGVSYKAFIHQKERCEKSAQSCLEYQPYHYWSADKEVKDASARKYWLGSRAAVGPHPVVQTDSARKRIQLQYQAPHISRVTVFMSADNLVLLEEGTGGAIIEANSYTNHENLIFTVHVYNSGQVAGVFRTHVASCKPLLTDTAKSEHFHLGPHKSVWVTLSVPFEDSNRTTIDSYCSVHISDHYDKVVAQRQVLIHPEDDCYCVVHCICHCGNEANQWCLPVSQQEYHQEGLPGAVPIGVPIPRISMYAAHIIGIIIFVLLILVFLGVIKMMLGLFVSPAVGEFGLMLFKDPNYSDEDERQMSRRTEMTVNVLFFLYVMVLPIHIAIKAWLNRGRADEYKKIEDKPPEEPSSAGSTPYPSPEKCPTCSTHIPTTQRSLGGKAGFVMTDREAALLQLKRQKRVLKKLSERRRREEQLLHELRDEEAALCGTCHGHCDCSHSTPDLSTTAGRTNQTPTASPGSVVTPSTSRGEKPSRQGKTASTHDAEETVIRNSVFVPGNTTADSDFDLRGLTTQQREFLKRVTRGDVRVFMTCTQSDIHLTHPGTNYCLCGHLRQADRVYKFSLGPYLTQFYEVVDGEKRPLLTPLPINPKSFHRTLSLGEVLRLIAENPIPPCLNFAWDKSDIKLN